MAVRRWRPGAPRSRRFVRNYEHVLGTSLELHVLAEREDVAARAEEAMLAEMDRLEPILSGWRSTSEFARWQTTLGEDVPVSPELADVLEACETWRLRTRGAFDPAAQAIIDLLRESRVPPSTTDALPSLLEERRRPHWLVNRRAGTARRLTPLAVSLDAIAKGYIVAAATRCARTVPGVTDAMLNVGGDLQHLGAQSIVVGIADPLAPAENASPIAVVRIQNAALATSGGYRRGFVLNGRRVSHIVDPRTGVPAERIASASVIAPDCTTADALSTAFSVMHPRDSVALADSLPGVGCLLVESDGTIAASAAWIERAVRPRQNTIHSRHQS